MNGIGNIECMESIEEIETIESYTGGINFYDSVKSLYDCER